MLVLRQRFAALAVDFFKNHLMKVFARVRPLDCCLHGRVYLQSLLDPYLHCLRQQGGLHNRVQLCKSPRPDLLRRLSKVPSPCAQSYLVQTNPGPLFSNLVTIGNQCAAPESFLLATPGRAGAPLWCDWSLLRPRSDGYHRAGPSSLSTAPCRRMRITSCSSSKAKQTTCDPGRSPNRCNVDDTEYNQLRALGKWFTRIDFATRQK